MKTFRIFTLIFACFLISSKGNATHITNAELQCSFVDSSGSNYLYMVRLILIRDCRPGNIEFPSRFDIGAYFASNSQLAASKSLPLINNKLFSDCYGICQEQGIFEGILTLPKINGDYHIFAQFCCRNNTKNILADQNNNPFQGNLLYCLINGSTPVSTSTATLPPFIYVKTGISDTIDYRITDPLADSIAMSMSTPYLGATLANNYPEIPATFPGFSPVTYNTGYNVVNPLGTGSKFETDQLNKKIYILGNSDGNFTVAFTISAYRNGKLISRIIKEVIVYVSPSFTSEPEIKITGYANPGPSSNLNWTTCIPDINKYYIERSDSVSGNYKVIDSVAGMIMTYRDIYVLNKKVYYYRIKAQKINGSLLYTDSVRIQTWGADIQNQFNYESSGLKVMPSPLNGICSLRLSNNSFSAYKITDISGRTVFEGTNINNDDETEADLSFLVNGLYLVMVYSHDGEKHIAKFYKE